MSQRPRCMRCSAGRGYTKHTPRRSPVGRGGRFVLLGAGDTFAARPGEAAPGHAGNSPRPSTPAAASCDARRGRRLSSRCRLPYLFEHCRRRLHGAPTHALLAAGLRACRSALLASFAFLISASVFSSFRFASIGCSFSPSALDSKETTERSVKRASAVAAAGATEASVCGGGTACPAGTTGSSIRPNMSSAASATGRAAGLRFMPLACGPRRSRGRLASANSFFAEAFVSLVSPSLAVLHLPT